MTIKIFYPCQHRSVLLPGKLCKEASKGYNLKLSKHFTYVKCLTNIPLLSNLALALGVLLALLPGDLCTPNERFHYEFSGKRFERGPLCTLVKTSLHSIAKIYSLRMKREKQSSERKEKNGTVLKRNKNCLFKLNSDFV